MELQEKDFISEGWKKNPKPLFWSAVAIAGVAFCMWIGKMWQDQEMADRVKNNPFLNVSNRDFSLFLWENPEFMRANAKTKTGYLPAFSGQGPSGLLPDSADDIVQAPPEALFRYHTWARILRHRFYKRDIPKALFLKFLEDCPYCRPAFWPAAPKQYVELAASIEDYQKADYLPDDNLAALSVNALPLAIRLQFQGWRNYRLEGDAINQIQPSSVQMRAFLRKYPEFSVSLWKNIYPKYLKSLDVEGIIPSEEVPPFLKAAFFNDLVAY